MSTHFKRSLKCKAPSMIVIAGKVVFGASGAVASVSGAGIASAAETSTGLYTITLDKRYEQLIAATASVQLATPADSYCNIGAYTAADKTIVVNLMEGASAAEPTSGDSINIVIVVSESAVLA